MSNKNKNEDEEDNPRLSRKVDAVGFFDISNPKPMLDFWQMHTPPSRGDTVVFDEELSGSAAGEWEVVGRRWCCVDGPFTVQVFLKKISHGA